MYPGQPLLQLKQSHNPHNLLVNFEEEGLLICMLEFLQNIILVLIVRDLYIRIQVFYFFFKFFLLLGSLC